MEKKDIVNALYGAIIGDALGVPAEFTDRVTLKEKPVTTMLGHGTYNLSKGSWSDDSSLMLCLADSIGIHKELDYTDIMKRFASWLFSSKYTPDHDTFDCGRSCYNAILKFKRGTAALQCGGTQENENGNGSLMRIAPLPFYLFSKYGPDAMGNDDVFTQIHNISSLTHAHPVSFVACDLYCAIMIEILKGTKKNDLQAAALRKIGTYADCHPEYNLASERYERMFHLNFKDIPEDEIQSTGYVVHTMEAAFWCFLNTENYKDCVLKAVNLGFDTDTVACVAGSIAGLYYGDLPEEWHKAIRRKGLIDKVIERFSTAVLSEVCIFPCD